jgi:hypothetical protein
MLLLFQEEAIARVFLKHFFEEQLEPKTCQAIDHRGSSLDDRKVILLKNLEAAFVAHYRCARWRIFSSILFFNFLKNFSFTVFKIKKNISTP